MARRFSAETVVSARTKSKQEGKHNGGRKSKIAAWEDDPMSSGAKVVLVPLPEKTPHGFRIEIEGDQPKIAVYKKPGTIGFRYWNAFDALHRSAKFWRTTLDSASSRAKDWYTGSPLHVGLVQGDELNAYYDRKRLSFFRAKVGGRVIYSGESPDVLAHELGHAILDSIQPLLWDAASDEIAAFHESFADISSICTALQLEPLRRAAIKETGTNFYGSSRVSRLAEQLGWAIRQVRADASDLDCLRNAVNSFCYQPPETLPHEAPSTMISSESHSFSRVFTAGFFGMLCNMFGLRTDRQPDADRLLEVTNDAAILLTMAVEAAPVTTNFYTEVAIEMLTADQNHFGGRYADAIKTAFVRRGILPLQIPAERLNRPEPAVPAPLLRLNRRVGAVASAAVQETEVVELHAVAGAPDSDGLMSRMLSGRELGLPVDDVCVLVPARQPERYHKRVAAFARFGEAGSTDEDPDKDARLFVENLIRRSKIDLSSTRKTRDESAHPMVGSTHPLRHATHALVREGAYFSLVRCLFEGRTNICQEGNK